MHTSSSPMSRFSKIVSLQASMPSRRRHGEGAGRDLLADLFGRPTTLKHLDAPQLKSQRDFDTAATHMLLIVPDHDRKLAFGPIGFAIRAKSMAKKSYSRVFEVGNGFWPPPLMKSEARTKLLEPLEKLLF
ncbi:hypothetical protein VNO77_19442 [Canavalia gladiata]|uniref:Uncharacterized protein n=1 Tax=Canavalia gladiata TaxID=3824 RepID=A0AAN9QIH9_CANGL